VWPIGIVVRDLARVYLAALACLLEDMVHADVAEGRLTRVLVDWCPPFSGYHLYYPSRRQPTPAFALLVKELRFGGERLGKPRSTRRVAAR
jgi:DNA-binding transcriptional LysR family regulator